MKNSILSLIVALILLASGLTACYLEDSCSPDELYAPSNLTPNTDTPLDNLLPQLSWSYPEGCEPESFVVEVSTGLTWAGERTLAYRAEVPGSERTVVVGPLSPGTHYYWIVYAVGDGEHGTHAWGNFIAGTWCTAADRLSYSPPILLSPAEGQVISDTTTITLTHEDTSTETFAGPRFTFLWQNSMSCLPPEGYTVEYSDNPRFESRGPATQRISTGVETSIYDFLWDVENTHWYECLRIYWRVLIGEYQYDADPYSEVYAVSETRSFIINTTGTFCMPDFGLILTPIPWIDVPLPADILTATTLEDANCRSGPTTEFSILSILPAGTPYEIQARNTPGDSWMVFDPAISHSCWVADSLVDVIGDTSLVMIIDPDPPGLVAAPTETETPVDCSQWSSDQQACIANPACEWQPNLYPSDPCRNK